MSRRVCVTRQWKESHPVPSPRGKAPAAAAPPSVFQGTLFLVDLTWQGPGGPWKLSDADIATLLSFLESAAPQITAYASQYGPAGLEVASKVIPMTVRIAQPSYTDKDLQSWVNGVAAKTPLPADSAVVVVNPPGLVNEDAKEAGGVGVLGYHGMAKVPYAFVNALGSQFTVDDAGDLFAEALSHEVAELVVDPRADGSQPEVCDGCGTNCQGAAAFRCYFDANGSYLGAGPSFPPPFAYAYFVSAVARPTASSDCPAAEANCAYPPP